jgi:hypothetical protein
MEHRPKLEYGPWIKINEGVSVAFAYGITGSGYWKTNAPNLKNGGIADFENKEKYEKEIIENLKKELGVN